MSLSNLTLIQVLAQLRFDEVTGKVYRMFQGPEDNEEEGLREYEMPLTDIYLNSPFDPSIEWPDFFAEDTKHFYFPVPALSDGQVTLCKIKKSSRQLFPLQVIQVRHENKMIRLSFSKQLVLETGDIIIGEGTVAVYWREARIAAVGDSIDTAMARVGIHIVNRLVTTTSQKTLLKGKKEEESASSSSYTVRSDLLITKLLHKEGINVAVHCTEIPSEQQQQQDIVPPDKQNNLTSLMDDPYTNHTLQDVYDRNKDPKFN